jgi:hypothetical protein
MNREELKLSASHARKLDEIIIGGIRLVASDAVPEGEMRLIDQVRLSAIERKGEPGRTLCFDGKPFLWPVVP